MARLDARNIVELAEGWVAHPRRPCYPPADGSFLPWTPDSSQVVVKLILLRESHATFNRCVFVIN